MRFSFISMISLISLILIACDSEDSNGTTAGTLAGSQGGSPAGVQGGSPAGAQGGLEGGTPAGSEGGSQGGNQGGSQGGSQGGTPAGAEGGNQNATLEILPPKATTLTPPTAIQDPFTRGEVTGCSNGTWLEEVRGWVVDDQGSALAGAKVQFCVDISAENGGEGSKICLMPATSGDDGYFKVSVPQNARCMKKAAIRSLVPSQKRATTYCHGDLSSVMDSGILRLNDPLVLYAISPATILPTAEDMNASYEVAFEDQLSLSIVPSQLYNLSYDKLGSRFVPLDAPGLCFLDTESKMMLDGLYALYPEDDLVDGVASIKVPNVKAHPVDTAIDFYVVGGLDCSLSQDQSVAEGDWQKVATGKVDASGEWIVSDEMNGLPCLTWFGYGKAN